MILRLVLFWLLCSLASGPARAAPMAFDLPNPPPPAITDATKGAPCTVTWLISDIATNDTLAVRMTITARADVRPVNGLYPCPATIAPRVAIRALDACVTRAADSKTCVYTDMGRDFDKRPAVNNSAENTSRCASDKASDIGVACWRSGRLEICGTGCGDSPESAIAAAVNRCESKHQKSCPITGSLPVLAPK